MVFIGCFEDKNGNAPLVMNEKGYLVDNPDYKTEYDEKMEPYREAVRQARKDDGTSIDLGNKEPTIEDRENFAKNFKPKSGAATIKLSGKNKTTIEVISGFATEFTAEQFDNLGYYHTFKELGFKKVKFNNGREVVATRSL